MKFWWLQQVMLFSQYSLNNVISTSWTWWYGSFAGKDATDDFEDVGHSTSARAMLDEFYVGDVDSSTISTKTASAPPKQIQLNQDSNSGFVIKLLQFLVPLLILGLAVGVRFYTKSSA